MLVPQVVTLPTNRKPPSHLGEIEVGIWKRVLADYQFGTAIAFDVLTTRWRHICVPGKPERLSSVME
jgi:hypothetical protein